MKERIEDDRRSTETVFGQQLRNAREDGSHAEGASHACGVFSPEFE